MQKHIQEKFSYYYLKKPLPPLVEQLCEICSPISDLRSYTTVEVKD